METDTKSLFQITEAAHACGVSRSTLMRMEEKGLLAPAYVAPESGRRYYDNHNVARVLQIEKFKSMGLGAQEIADYFVRGGEVSGLLAVVSMACLLKMKCTPFVAKRLSEKFGKLWLAAEVILFVLVGAEVDIRYMAGVGLAAVGMIFSALIFRAVGVCLCLVRTPLTAKERLYCVFAYLPKATVQAAIGSVPLAAGLPCGSIVLSVAVLGIVITAPLGAFLMDTSAPKLLSKAEE